MSAAILGMTFLVMVAEADARRTEGGKTAGVQRESVAKPVANQTRPVTGAPAGTAAPAPKRSWLGLFAGLGVAALLSQVGVSGASAGLVLLILLVLVLVFCLRFFRRRSEPDAMPEPLHFAGIGGPNLAPLPKFETATPLPPTSSAKAALKRRIPGGFDSDGFCRQAEVVFMRLQAAHDAGNLASIRELVTPAMFTAFEFDIEQRQERVQHTNILALESELLEVVDEGASHFASIRFRGESGEAAQWAQPFDEVWKLFKADDGSDWVLAGIQQLR